MLLKNIKGFEEYLSTYMALKSILKSSEEGFLHAAVGMLQRIWTSGLFRIYDIRRVE